MVVLQKVLLTTNPVSKYGLLLTRFYSCFNLTDSVKYFLVYCCIWETRRTKQVKEKKKRKYQLLCLLQVSVIVFIFKLSAGQQPSEICKLESDTMRKGVLSNQGREQGVCQLI